jgi:hypothetical protein
MTTPETDPEDLFFDGVIRRYVGAPRFQQRRWLANLVSAELDAGQVALLTAEPGFGKSALMAQLAADNPDWLRYFIRRDQRSAAASGDVRSFLLRIGAQLAAIHPELFTEEQIQIDVQQRVGDVEADGELIGIEVERILASPFHQVAVRIRQDVARAGGDVTGLRVHNWIADPRTLDVADLAAMALLDPAAALARTTPEALVVVLVDALDELAHQPEGSSLLDWLGGVVLPPNVQLILTSRPEPALATVVERRGTSIRQVWLDPADPRVQEDLSAYADLLAADPAVKVALAAAERPKDRFIADVVARSDGNIGYLDALGRAVDASAAMPQALGELLARGALPPDTTSIHAFFLRQIRNGPGRELIEVSDPDTGELAMARAWTAAYRPLLETLVAAAEPLTFDELAGFCGATVVDAVLRIGQFLDRIGNAYRFYHPTLGEFLTADSTRADPDTAELYVDPVRAHRRLAGRIEALATELWNDAVAPSQIAFRRYARTYRMWHLFQSGWHSALFQVLDHRLHGRQQLRADPSGVDFLTDLTLAVDALSSVDDELDRLARAFRYHLLRTSLAGQAAAYPLDGYAAVCVLRGPDYVRRLIDLIPDPLLRSGLLADVAATCASIDPDAAAAVAAAAVDTASYWAATDDRLNVLHKLLTAWQEVAATGRCPSRETSASLVDLANAAPETLYRLKLLVTVARLYASAPNEPYENGLIDVVFGLAPTPHNDAAILENDRFNAMLIPMYLDLGRPDLAEFVFSLYAGDAFPILDGIDAFDTSLPAGAEPWLTALAEAVDDTEPHAGAWLLVRLAAVYIRIGQPDQALHHVARAVPMLLDQSPDHDALVLAANQLCELGAYDLYTTLADRVFADGLAALVEQPDDSTFALNVVTAGAGQTLVAIGDLDRALAITRALQPFERDDLYESIAAAHARAGRLDEALVVLEESADAAAQSLQSVRIAQGEAEPGVLEVVRALVLAGRLDDAFEVVAARDSDSQSMLNHGIVLALLRAGDRASANELLEREELRQREYFQFNDWCEAAQILIRLLGMANSWTAAVAFHRAWDDSIFDWQPTRALTGRLVAAGEFDAARDLLDGVDSRAQTAGLLEIAKLADPPRRDAALADAERLVSGIASQWARAEGYTMIAEARNIHDPLGARRLLTLALDSLAGLDLDEERGLIYPNTTPYPRICAALARTGDSQGALDLFYRIPETDYVDRAIAASMLAEAFEAIGSDVDIEALLYKVADSIPAARDDTLHPRIFALAGLAQRGRLADILDRYNIGPGERGELVNELKYRLHDDRAFDAACELLRDFDESDAVRVWLVDAFLRRHRASDAMATLARITDRAKRAKPVAWCAAYLAVNHRNEEAAVLLAEGIDLLPELFAVGGDAGAALGFAMMTLHGRGLLVRSAVEGWASAATFGEVVRRLTMLMCLVDEEAAVAERLAESYTWARSFQTV